MAVATYMTCVLKDLLSCPRPGMVAARLGGAAAAGKAKAEDEDEGEDRALAGSQPHASRMGASLASRPTVVAYVSPSACAASAHGTTAIAASSASPPSAAAPVSPGGRGQARVQVLEEAYRGEVEMGAPSMHTWCALVMPCYAIYTAYASFGALSATTAAWLAAAAVAWSIWIACSRLYLGVHTPVDLVTGFACGAAFLGLWCGGGAAHVAAAARGGAALAATAALYGMALCTYPRPLSYTTSYEYPVIFLGAALGGLAGLADRHSLAARLLPLAPPPPAPLAAALRHPALLLPLGYASVALVKLLSKALLSAALPAALGAAPAALRRAWQPHAVHPAGCWLPARGRAEAGAEAEAGGQGEGDGRQAGGRSGRRPWLLMKGPRLAYDVDFLRKFVNYGATVYAVVEFGRVAAWLRAES